MLTPACWLNSLRCGACLGAATLQTAGLVVMLVLSLSLSLVFKSKAWARLNLTGLAKRGIRARLWEESSWICSTHTMRASRNRREQKQVEADRLAVCFGTFSHRPAFFNSTSRLETLMHVADTCSSMRDC